MKTRNHLPPVAEGWFGLPLACVALWLSGCTTGAIVQSGAATPVAAAGIQLQGMVHGGQQPISGGVIQLYASGQPSAPTSGSATGGFGQGATALLAVGSMTVGSSNNYYPNGGGSGATCAYTAGNTNQCTALPQTDASGGFNISSDYTCPSSTSQVYIVATGGNPGLSGTVNNPYIALMAGLGACGNLSSSTFISINEVTTVAAVWSLQQFMAAPDGVHAASSYTSQGGSYTGTGVSIGASSGPVGGYGPDHVQTQQIGLSNAFRMIGNLANNATGASVPVNAWATPYSTKINAIANTLASCVNTDGVTSNACSTLMSDAAVNSLTPQDTIQAAYLMAHNPFNNANTLVGLASTSPPFQPSLASVNDLSIEVGFAPTFTSGTNVGAYGLYATTQIAIDEMGRVWAYNAGTSSATANDGFTGAYISEIDANGQALSGPFQTYTVAGGYVGSNNSCTSSTIHTLASSNYGMAIDQNGYLWAGNENEPVICTTSSMRSVFRIDTDTATQTNGYYFLGQPGAATVDASNNVWLLGNSGRLQAFSSNTGTSVTYKDSSTDYGGGVTGAATDMLGNVWLETGLNCNSSSAGLLNQVLASTYASPKVADGIYTSGDTSCTSGTSSITTTAVVNGVESIATDANNGIWATNVSPSGTNTVTYFAPQSTAWSTAVSGSTAVPLTGAYTSAAGLGGLSNPYGVSVDGANHAWIMNSAVTGTNPGIAISELAVTLASDGTKNLASSPITSVAGSNGFLFPNRLNPFPALASHSTAIDPSGNVWLTSSGSSSNYISVIVGAATPVIAPLALQTEYGLVGTATAAPISITLSPTSVTLADGASSAFTATLTNDTSNAGVTWSIGTGVGSLTASSTAGVTYNAPAGLPGAATVTLIATSIADPTKSASATITITAPTSPASKWVYYNASGNLVYNTISNTHNTGSTQDQIMDFSTAGYNQGAGPLPTVAATVTVSPSGGDDTANIQAAINMVSAMSLNATTGFRGAVLLSAGSFKVNTSLLITASGVVLQGSGSGTSTSANTVINMMPTPTSSMNCSGTATITCTNPTNQTTCVATASGGQTLCTNTTNCLNYSTTQSGGMATEASTSAITSVAYPLVIMGTCGSEPSLISTTSIGDNYVPAGATTLQVGSTSNLSVGTTVLVERPVTTGWLTFMDMLGNSEIDPNATGCANNGGTCTWIPVSTSAFKSDRTITAIGAKNEITLDAPIADSIDSQYLTGSVSPYTFTSRISQVGLENLRVVAPTSPETYGMPTYQLLVTYSVLNGWARNLTAQDTLGSIDTNAYTKQFTVYNIALTHTVQLASGGALFADLTIDTNASQVLMDTISDSDNNIFFFETSSEAQGPNVLRNATFQGNNSIQPHQRWATGLLIEDTTISAISNSTQGTVALQDRGNAGSGQGWAIGWGVVWNTTAYSFTIQQPPGSQNWCIGCVGSQLTTAAPGGTSTVAQGAIDSSGTYVFPTSLYQAQLTQRLGPGYTAQ